MNTDSTDKDYLNIEKDCTENDDLNLDTNSNSDINSDSDTNSEPEINEENNSFNNIHEKDSSIKDILKNNEKSENKAFVEQKSMQQVIDESKIQTEKELIKLGQQLKEKEQKENNLKLNLTKSKEILSKYKDKDSIQIVDEFIKNKKYIELKELIDVLMNHESIVNEILVEKDKKIEKLDTQLDDSIQDNKDLMQENNDLEDKIEKYWEPRVAKLRGMLIERKKLLKYYHIGYILIIFHTFIFTKYGIYSYLNFWYQLCYLIYQIIYFLIFLLPNTYQIITNPNTYHILNNKIIEILYSFTTYIYFKTLSILNQIQYFIFGNNVTSGILIFTFIVIITINKYMR